MNEMQYTSMLETAFQDEAEGIEFYQHFIDMLPNTVEFLEIRRALQQILDEEKEHLNTLAQLIDVCSSEAC